MFNNVKLTEAHVSTKILAFLFDILSIIISSVILFYVCLYAFVKPFTNYDDNKNYVHQLREDLNMNLPAKQNYSDYENVIKEFYFEEYPNELKEYFSKYHVDENYSIVHFYNIYVLSLPAEPTPANFRNDLFCYTQNENGAYDVDSVGIKVPGQGGPRNEKNLYDFFHGKYDELDTMLGIVEPTYKDKIQENLVYQTIDRMSVLGFSVILFYIVIPFLNKDRATLAEKFFNFAHVNFKDGYRVKWYKIVLRPLIYYALPLVILTFGFNFKMVMIAIAPLFASFLVLIFSSTNRDIPDLFLKMQTVLSSDSLIFSNEDEEKLYEKSAEYKKLEDEAYTSRLANFETINFSESRRDEIIKNESDKGESSDEN